MTHDSVYNLESNIVEKKEWFNLLEEKKRSSYFIKKFGSKIILTSGNTKATLKVSNKTPISEKNPKK